MPASDSSPIPRPPDDAARVDALRRYGVLDTPNDEEFDFLAEMAALVCGTPFSFVVLVDEDRTWVKSAHGCTVQASRPRDEDYCAWTILEPEALDVPDLLADERTARLPPTQQAGYRMYSGVSLRTGDGHCIGTLCVMDLQPRELTARQRELLGRLARQVMSLIELRAAQRELAAAVQQLDRLARTDELTGLLNRRALMQALEVEVSRLGRYGGELSLVLLDIDHFKAINDEFGHPAGDEVLRRVCATVSDSIRNTDVAGRYGGEEFLLVLPHTGLPGAHVLAETLRARIAAQSFEHIGRGVTASFGVATLAPGTDMQTAVSAVDHALYEAKQGGRDQVRLAPMA